MKNMMKNALVAAALGVLTGCATVYRVSEAPCPDNPAASQHAVRAMRDPVVRVDVASVGGQAAPLADAVKAEIENRLATRGFTVAPKKRPDSVVAVSLSSWVKDRMADWKLYEGKADVRIDDPVAGKVVAAQSFTAAGARALDAEKAMAGVKDGLSRQMLPWLDKALPLRKIALPPPPPAPAAALVTIAAARRSENPSAVLAVQRNFMESIAGHPGVVDCRLVGETPSKRAYTFRVAYDPCAFPGGLLNTLVLDAPELGENVELQIVR